MLSFLIVYFAIHRGLKEHVQLKYTLAHTRNLERTWKMINDRSLFPLRKFGEKNMTWPRGRRKLRSRGLLQKRKLTFPFLLGFRRLFESTVKSLRHRFGQPWLFVSSGNAKGKGVLPPPFPTAALHIPVSLPRSLPLPWSTRTARASGPRTTAFLSCAADRGNSDSTDI